ncbi:permease [Oceanobacillus manasiensis]|uniref:permease n=1 Tax=Oceanobacillus manasiensis TaxID=586413 RepID=UPI0005A7DCA8|nr:permease [Oceanobacillus manasiensis]
MLTRRHTLLVELTGLFIFAIVMTLLTLSEQVEKIIELPKSIYHMNMLFLSILIEALPFVLIGVLIAGLIQVFVTDEHIRRWIPRNKYLAITMSCVVGACFPACECGIVPIVRRLVGKGVPIYAGIGFLLTGPLINPIVILSTYMAFGNDAKIAAARMILGFVIAMVVAIIISFLFKGNQLKQKFPVPSIKHTGLQEKVKHTFTHAVDEFFDMGKYLIIGAALAAFVQTYISSGDLVSLGGGVASATVVMMALAYILSLCSEADAFIGASFRGLFPDTAILGFLIYGPMIDMKNTFMMLSVFKAKFVTLFVLIVTIIVFLTLMLFQVG